MGEALADIERAVKEIGLPPGYTTGVTGMGKYFAEMLDSFRLAFLLSIIGASQGSSVFSSFSDTEFMQ